MERERELGGSWEWRLSGGKGEGSWEGGRLRGGRGRGRGGGEHWE